MHPKCIWQPAGFIPAVPKACAHWGWYLSVPASSRTQSQSHCSHRSARSWVFVWYSGVPTVPRVPGVSLSEPECSLHWGWCEIFSFSGGCWVGGSPGLIGKAVFLLFCHAQGGSAIYEWFNVFIYTMQPQNVLELMQGITKQMGKTLFLQCVRRDRSVRDGVCRVWGTAGPLWHRSCLGNSFPSCSRFIPVIVLPTSCCGARVTGHWAGMTWECNEQLPWQAGQQLAPPYVLQYFLIPSDFLFFKVHQHAHEVINTVTM